MCAPAKRANCHAKTGDFLLAVAVKKEKNPAPQAPEKLPNAAVVTLLAAAHERNQLEALTLRTDTPEEGEALSAEAACQAFGDVAPSGADEALDASTLETSVAALLRLTTRPDLALRLVESGVVDALDEA